jgi:PAS domain S-box-containing protein
MDDGTASAMTSRIADVLASLANRLAVATWRSEIDTILPSLCAAVGMSAASLFELRLAAGRWNAELVSTWPVREQADPRHDRFGELSQRWVRALAEGRALPGDTDDVSWYVRRVLERSGHSGSVILPVIAGDKPWGFITLEGSHEVRRWTRTDLAVLAAIGSVIGAAIARERTDRDLRDAELRYQTLIEQIPAITYIDQPDADSPTGFRPVFVSPQAERILGYRPAEIEGNANLWIELLHPDDRERALAADAAHHATGDPLENEYRLLARDGRIVWVRDEARMVRDEFGDPMYSHGVLLDITEQKRADLRRRESEALLRAIVESEPECVTLVDRRGRVKMIQPRRPADGRSRDAPRRRGALAGGPRRAGAPRRDQVARGSHAARRGKDARGRRGRPARHAAVDGLARRAIPRRGGKDRWVPVDRSRRHGAEPNEGRARKDSVRATQDPRARAVHATYRDPRRGPHDGAAR